MFAIRSLLLPEVPRLAEIKPDFIAYTTIQVEKIGLPPYQSWKLNEIPLKKPFQKGQGYDFDLNEQANIRQRLSQKNTLIEVVENTESQRLVGILDIEEEKWRQTAWVWNIMLDKSVQKHGLGRQLMERAITWSRKRQLRAVMLETQSNNTPACQFYAHMGFKLIGINDIFYTNQDISRGEVALFWAFTL